MPRTRPAPIPSRLVRAAGAVVWRFTDHNRPLVIGEIIRPCDIEVLIVHRPHYRDWSWPKGKAESNEPIVQAAVREVEEETGVAIRLGAPLTMQRYRLGTGQTKEVHYWVGTPLAPELEQTQLPGAPALRSRKPVHPASAREIDQTRWVSPQRADALLTRRGDRRLLSDLLTRAKKGTLVTATIALLRHGKAESRSSWQGSDRSRPLTRLGVRQALDVVDLLSAFGMERALTSPWTRCAATVSPWARLASAELETVDALTETAVYRDPHSAQHLLAEHLRSALYPEVWSIHRPTMPTLMEPLKAVTAAPLRGQYPDHSPWLATAEMLVAHISRHSGIEVVGLERHGTRTKDLLGE